MFKTLGSKILQHLYSNYTTSGGKGNLAGKSGHTYKMRYKKKANGKNTYINRHYYRERKIETFSRRRRPDWQSKPGTEVAVASLQNSNIKIAVNSGGRRLGRLAKKKIWLRMKN